MTNTDTTTTDGVSRTRLETLHADLRTAVDSGETNFEDALDIVDAMLDGEDELSSLDAGETLAEADFDLLALEAMFGSRA